jgi:hypothetical protein
MGVPGVKQARAGANGISTTQSICLALPLCRPHVPLLLLTTVAISVVAILKAIHVVAPSERWAVCGTVCIFRQKFTLEDAIGSHAYSLGANMRVTNDIPLGSSLSYQLSL